MGRRLLILAATLTLTAVPRNAAADITAFLGITPTPETHAVRGLAVGLGLLIIGFEGEYANLAENEDDDLPGLQTYSGNILVQTPIEVSGVQLYGTGGAGVYRERLVLRQETHLATNLGGGAKIRLLGPLRVRVDYRVFRLQGDPLHETYQRFYVGANLTF
ncbi:MAG: hypothetical protein ACRD1H_04485 [Vicinamibacterales bacterium]